MKTLYKVTYKRAPHASVIEYVIAENKLEAINSSQPFWNEGQPVDYNGVEITPLCFASDIRKALTDNLQPTTHNR